MLWCTDQTMASYTLAFPTSMGPARLLQPLCRDLMEKSFKRQRKQQVKSGRQTPVGTPGRPAWGDPSQQLENS